jgi:hypothetical protein
MQLLRHAKIIEKRVTGLFFFTKKNPALLPAGCFLNIEAEEFIH